MGRGPKYSRVLTPKEQAVLGYVMQGWNNHRIAAELGIREAAVRSRMWNINNKLGSGNRGEMLRFAHDMQVLGKYEC